MAGYRSELTFERARNKAYRDLDSGLISLDDFDHWLRTIKVAGKALAPVRTACYLGAALLILFAQRAGRAVEIGK